jgi:hypothetical protein
MLLFHGTSALALDGIMARGLQPPQPGAGSHDWVWDLSGHAQRSAVFLSTAPVASKGGDPVSFAMGWLVRRWRGRPPGYLVVVDLPPEALNLVYAVVPNVELNGFVGVYSARSDLRQTFNLEAGRQVEQTWSAVARWTLSHWCLHYWLARYCADHRISLEPSALEARATTRIAGIDPALPPDMTPVRWRAFLDDYFRLMDFACHDIRSPAERERRRRSILRRHSITLPENIEEDDHGIWCRLCVGGLVRFVHQFEGFADYRPLRDFLRTLPMKSAYARLPDVARVGAYFIGAPQPGGGLGSTQPLALRLRAVVAHTAPFGAQAVERFFRAYESERRYRPEAPWIWDQWYAAFPADRCTLAHAWRPGYCRHFAVADLKRPDRQVIAAAIPTRYILGAIKVSDGTRLAARVRPNRRRGETLGAKLWALALDLRAGYAGKPILLD